MCTGTAPRSTGAVGQAGHCSQELFHNMGEISVESENKCEGKGRTKNNCPSLGSWTQTGPERRTVPQSTELSQGGLSWACPGTHRWPWDPLLPLVRNSPGWKQRHCLMLAVAQTRLFLDLPEKFLAQRMFCVFAPCVAAGRGWTASAGTGRGALGRGSDTTAEPDPGPAGTAPVTLTASTTSSCTKLQQIPEIQTERGCTCLTARRRMYATKKKSKGIMLYSNLHCYFP